MLTAFVVAFIVYFLPVNEMFNQSPKKRNRE